VGSNLVCLLLSAAILVLKWRFDAGARAEPNRSPP